MTGLSRAKRNGLVALLAACVLMALVAWLRDGAAASVNERNPDEYPQLFDGVSTCPPRGDPLGNGRRSEELGLLRADRYAYNPRDGVRAVQRYQEAEACYRAAGSESDAARVARSISALSARVNTDYAAARLNLVNALEQDRWSVALSEIHRLLLLTEHLRRDEYVEWLDEIIGKTAARASTAR
ncbi:MAG: hypothetical protein WBB42_14485 [Polyangiales bacterium]